MVNSQWKQASALVTSNYAIILATVNIHNLNELKIFLNHTQTSRLSEHNLTLYAELKELPCTSDSLSGPNFLFFVPASAPCSVLSQLACMVTLDGGPATDRHCQNLQVI